MNRFFAIFIPILIISGVIPDILASEGNESLGLFLTAQAAGVISVILLIYYCGFAALHSIQHIDSPKERTKWFLWTILVNVFGSMYYYLTKYQELKKEGRGGLLKF